MKRSEDRDMILAELTTLHAKLKSLVVASGVREQHYDAPMNNANTHNAETLVALYDWLKDFESGPYTAVASIWKLKPPEWWHNTMVLFRMKKTREHMMLSQAKKKLRRAWYKRHTESSENETPQESLADANQESSS